MKLLFYNLGYGRGHDGSVTEYILKSYRFIHQSEESQQAVLQEVVDLINQESPDVFAYAEISTGSYRNRYFNQHQYLTKQLTASVVASAVSKYGESVLNVTPFHAGNCNGVIAFTPVDIREYYLQRSRKRLVFKITLPSVVILAVHLPLVSTDRYQQLLELAEIVNGLDRDCVVCGDFNILNGLDELEILCAKTNLQVVNPTPATFPAYRPRLPLDVCLYRFQDQSIQPTVRVPAVCASDHLPVVFEW